MRIVRTLGELEPSSVKTGFVPTMGAFHEGHLSLMRRARAECERVVTSLFVNPTQFGPNEDLSRYPRPFERDVSLAESVGVDVLFAPDAEEIYDRSPTVVHVPEVTELWEGPIRPGHFDGVATIVLKLFQLVGPTIAYFGQKDLQQCLVIRKMVRDLNVPVQLVFAPTVREPDGLAMSSRNVYLSPEHRAIAPLLARLLHRLAASNLTDASLEAGRMRLAEAGFLVDYLEWVDLDAMRPTRDYAVESAIIATAKLGSTRLLDNVLVNGSL